LFILYRILFILFFIVASPYLLIKALWGHHGITERLGFVQKRNSNGRLFWFHAASVGELKILSAVIPEMKKLLPTLEIAISTTTATGKRQAEKLFGDMATIFFQPLEVYSAIIRAIENLKPEKLILVETEIWPLLITTAADCGVEVDLVNARISAKSFGFYKWFPSLLKNVMNKFSYVLTQTEIDAARFRSLGVPNPLVVGNIKFDQALNGNGKGKPAFVLSNSVKLIFVAGSIRKGEDEIFADLIADVREKDLPVFFVLVPRHMNEVDDVCAHLKNRNIGYALWSDAKGSAIDSDLVLVVNTMGELLNFYLAADLTFVGGSLVPIGGHDPAEPASLGKPVLFGPYMENARAAADLLIKSGGAQAVNDKQDLLNALCDASKNKNALIERGQKAQEAILSMSGISKKIARILIGDGK
jgi:3-deoxy-D-manno-octulosonic-acid transferase